MIDSPLRTLTPKGRILWSYNSGRSKKNLMSADEALFSIPKPLITLYHLNPFLRGWHLWRPSIYIAKKGNEARMRDCGAPIAPARHSKMHVGLSKNTASRETKNEIEGIVSIKRIEHQTTDLIWMAEEDPYRRGATTSSSHLSFSCVLRI